jgi:hypothetical protein
LVDDTPESRYGAFDAIKKILEKADTVKHLWIRIDLALVSDFCDPIGGLSLIYDLEKVMRI